MLGHVRTCPIRAYGSSSHGFADATLHRVSHHRRRERVTLQQPLEAVPGNGAAPFAALQPLPPEADHRVPEAAQRFAVARDSVIREVAT